MGDISVNRYYLKCPVCGEKQYLGKSYGSGIYECRLYGEVLEQIYKFMYDHLNGCHKDNTKPGEIFTVWSDLYVV